MAVAVSGVQLSLEVDGNAIQSLPASAARGSTSVTFAPFTVASRNTRRPAARRRAERDNVFHFVVSPSEPVRVFVIGRAGAEWQSLYLARAVSLGETLRVELVTRTATSFSDADARQAGVVITANGNSTPDELADRLARFVREEAGSLIPTGPQATSARVPADVVPPAISAGPDGHDPIPAGRPDDPAAGRQRCSHASTMERLRAGRRWSAPRWSSASWVAR